MNLTTTANSNSSDNSTAPSETTKIIKVVVYSLFLLIGTIGNILVIVILRDKKRRTINDYFIFNLAASDLIFILLTHPTFLYELFEQIQRNVFYCKAIWPLMSISLFVSIFTMTCMALERCRAILLPFRTRTNPRNIIILLICVWIASVISILPLILVAEPSNETLCNENWPTNYHRRAYTAALFVLQYAIPLSIIVIAYIRIALHITHARVPRTSVNHRGQLVRLQAKTENIQIIKTLAAIVFLFAVCMLPNQIAWMIMDFGKEEQKHLSVLFWEFSEAMIFLHSSLNPIVYGTLTQRFRRGYVKYIKYIICGCRSHIKDSIVSDQSYRVEDGRHNTRDNVSYRGSMKSMCLLKLNGNGTHPQSNSATRDNDFNGVSPGIDFLQTPLSATDLTRIQLTEESNSNSKQFDQRSLKHYNLNSDYRRQLSHCSSARSSLETMSLFGRSLGNSSPTASTSNLIVDSPDEDRKSLHFAQGTENGRGAIPGRVSKGVTRLEMKGHKPGAIAYVNSMIESDDEQEDVQDTKL